MFGFFKTAVEAARAKQTTYLYWCRACAEHFEMRIDDDQAPCQICDQMGFRECECGGPPGHVPNGTNCRKDLQ